MVAAGPAAVLALLAIAPCARTADDNEQLGYAPRTKHPIVDQVGGAAWETEGDGWTELLDGVVPPDPNSWDAQATVDGRDLALRLPSLVTNETNTRVHYHFFGRRLKLLGKFNVPGGLLSSDGHWDMLLDGVSVLHSNCNVSAENDAPSTMWCGEFAEQHHVLTVETGPNWHGELTVWNATATHMVMSQGDLDWSPKVYAGTAGNRLSFADEGRPNDAYKWTGEAGIEPYKFKNGAQIESVVLKGDTLAELTLPPNVSSYQLRGYVGPGYGRVFAHFEPAPPSVADTLNRTTDRPWIMETVLLHTPLDPMQIYTVRVSSEAATAGLGVHLNSTTVTPWWINTTNWFSDDRRILWANGSSTDPTTLPAAGQKKVDGGAIAGGVVGGVVGIALIAGLIWFNIRRRRKRPAKAGKRTPDHFVVDDNEDVSPYSEHHTAATPPDTSESGSAGVAELPMLQLPPLAHSGKHQQLPRLTMPGAAAAASVSNTPSLLAATKAGWYEGAPLSAAPLSAAPLSAAPRLPLPDEIPRETVFRQELDGGKVSPQNEVLVPPVYDPQWATANEQAGSGAAPLSPAGYSPSAHSPATFTSAAGRSPGGYSATTGHSPSSDQHTYSHDHLVRPGVTGPAVADKAAQDPFKTPATTPQNHVPPERYQLQRPSDVLAREDTTLQRRTTRPLPALPDKRGNRLGVDPGA